MADYTYLNEVPARRIHKSNAQDVLNDELANSQYLMNRLLALAACGPHEVEGESWDSYVTREVPEIVESLLESSHREFLAQYIIENADLVIDELESCANELTNAPRQMKFDHISFHLPWNELANLQIQDDE
jgi:hypothetical protein